MSLRAAMFLWLWMALAACHRPDPAPRGTPTRLVSMTPSATDLVVALGATDLLVGRDAFSTRPEQVAALPVVGDFINPNVEAIVALHPDLVLLDEAQSRARDALDAVGVATLSLSMHSVSDVRSGLIEVGKRLGRNQQASKRLAALDAKLDQVRKLGAARAVHPSVLVLIDRSPTELSDLIAAGPGSYLDELLTLTGCKNVMAGAPVRYPQVSADQLLRAAPDIIIDSSQVADDATALASWSLLAEVPAVAHGQVHVVSDRSLLSPSPRLGEALDHLMALTGGAPAL